MSDTYFTLKRPSEGLYKEKGSKFLAFAYPVKTEEEIKDLIFQLKKQYHDARHHCYAYILGRDKEDFRANDDGEPVYSAGDPILGQIRSHDLTDVLIVVIRYFGGTKLGVGGLVTAYKTAANEAIIAGEIVTEVVTETLQFDFDYLDMNEVMRLVKQHELLILGQYFDNHCTMTLAVRETLMQEVSGQLGKIASVKIKS